jgi:hypothetical protein
MSVANFGATFREQSVTNLLVADIVVPITANNAALVVTNLIQTADGAEIPLVLGEGVWAITARCAINPANAANTYQYIQSVLFVGGNLVAGSAPVFGGAVAGATNVELYLSLTYILDVPSGANRSLTYRLRSNGNSAAFDVTAGYSNIVATKLS